jgi:hypothetical protein
MLYIQVFDFKYGTLIICICGYVWYRVFHEFERNQNV